MRRAWRGVICVEGEQTGDGRYIVPGALEWSDPPMPLGWLQNEMHGMLLSGGTQVGTLETVAREGDEIIGTGYIDDEIPEGAELVRRMEAGNASHGDAVFVSIDPDNWEVELVVADSDEDDEGGVILIASGAGMPPRWVARTAQTAAAGDGDPADEGAVLFADSVDSWVERYTRLRIRGVTACAVSAFDRAFIRLDGEAAAEAETEATDEDAVTAAAIPVDPPAAWFEDPGFTEPTPLTVTDEGRVFGHFAQWGQCHIGHRGVCVDPPRSTTGYAHFATGYVRPAECDCGNVPTGVITMTTGHAQATPDVRAREAVAHYDNTGTAVADVVVGEDQYGPWVAGALRPTVTPEQVRELRGASLSGDWRMIGGSLELVAILAVNVPGFPVTRARAAVAASGEVVALVAAGAEPLARRQDQGGPARGDELDRRLARIESVVAPLEVEQLRAKVHGPGA